MAAMNRAQLVLARFDCAEYRLCRGLNRAASRRWIRQLMRLASRLGDGPLWYLLLPALPLLFGAAALRPALIMAVAGLAGHLIYRRLKATLVRERPFIRHAGINLEMPPLDRYSFPSGHTMHAVCFSWQAVAHFPVLGWLLLPVAALIALSRVVLGLHYPTDVIAGETLGALVARLGLAGDAAFVGYLDRERALADCYAAAAVFVFASRTETQGLVLLEAMAQGCAVVSTAYLGTTSILQAGCGARVAPEQPGAFAQAVLDLLDDPARAARCGAAARQYARLVGRLDGLAPAGVLRGTVRSR